MVESSLPRTSSPQPAQALHPVVDGEGLPHVTVTQFMVAVPVWPLHSKVLSLEDRAHELVGALDC